MALVGNISGSGGISNTIGITGSLIIANPGLAAFPGFPGTDTVFFVSGARDGKEAGSRTVAVFGGDTVVSGSLTIGTGSIRIDSNEIRFQGGIAKIVSGTGGLTFFDSGSPSGVTLATLAAGGGGGGTGTNFFYDTDGNAQVYTTGSVAFVGGGADYANNIYRPADKGADLFFYVSGSTDGTATALFGGAVVTSGSFSVKNAGGTEVAIIKNTGEITGSNVLASSITVNNNVVIGGDLTVNGTTVTVDATTLTIEDPVVGFGFTSGSTAATAGDRGFIGGINAADNVALFWDNTDSTFTAARTSTGAGNDPVAITSYTPFRASSFQVGGTPGSAVAADSAYISSSDALNVLVNHKASTTFAKNEVPTFKIGTFDPDGAFPDPEVGAIFGMGGTLASPVVGDLWISGSRVDLAHSLVGGVKTNGIGIVGGDTLGGLLRITKSGVTPTFNVEARDSSGGARDLVVTGSTITIGAHLSATGINFAGANTNIANLSAASSTTPSFVASQTNATFKVGTGGGTSDTLIISGTVIQLNAGASGQSFRRDNSEFLLVSSGASGPIQRSLVTAATGKMLVVGGSSETALSGSNLSLVAGTTGLSYGVDFSTQVSGLFQSYLNVVSGSYTTPVGTESLNAARIVPSDLPIPHDVLLGASSGKNLFLSGTGVEVNHGNASTFSLFTDGAEYLRFSTGPGLGTLIGGQVAGRNVSLTAAGAGKMILSGSTTTLSGSSIDFVNDSTKVAFFGTSGNSSGLIPNVTNAFDLGTPDLRWRNMYTGDLHLKNERGDWTVIEEEDFLTLTNNKSGKRYKFVLEEI